MGDHKPSDAELRERLTPEQYYITQQQGTEPAFSGRYYHNEAAGLYACVCCGETLFSSGSKYDSGSGWPSFWQPMDASRVETRGDESHGMTRTEARCAGCGAHLGHVFSDGPKPTGQRFCINSASLDFRPEKQR